MSLPLVQVGEDGVIRFSWSTADHYSEFEIHPDQTYEWFLKNRETGEFYGTDGPSSLEALAEKFLEYTDGYRKNYKKVDKKTH